MAESATRRPWYVAVVLGGLSAGTALAAAMGLAGTSAQGREPRSTASATASVPPGSLSLDERLNRIENALQVVKDEVAELRVSLPKKRGPP